MAQFWNFIRLIFIRHNWDDLSGDRRRCTVCDRIEVYDPLSSSHSEEWNCISQGRPKAHLEANG